MDLPAFAKTVAARVEAEAAQVKVPVAVCVIDIHGNVVLTHRMGGAPAFSLELAGEESLHVRPPPECGRLTSFRWYNPASRSIP